MNVVDPEIISDSIEPSRAEFEIRVPEDLLYLQGHFPQQPVLPGVTQVHWAIKLARLHFKLKPSFTAIEALKFHRIVEPQTLLKLVLELAETTGKLHFSYTSESGVHSQGRVVFE